MSIFPGKTRTTVGVVSTPLTDGTINDTTSVVLDAIYNDNSVTDSLIASSLRTLKLSVNNYKHYGETSYINGLPASGHNNYSVDLLAVGGVISSIAGEQVNIISSMLDRLSSDFLARWYLSENQGMDTNTLEVVSPPTTVTDQMGTLEKVYLKSSYLDDTRLFITYATLPVDPEEGLGPVEVVWSIDLLEFKSDISPYYQVTYSLVSDEENTPIYWLYNPVKGDHPSLNLLGDIAPGAPYLPIVPLRTDKVTINVDELSPAFISSSTLMNTLGMNLGEMCNGLNDNPDIADVDDAFFMFAIDVYTNSTHGLNYLNEYFKNLQLTQVSNKTEWETWFNDTIASHPRHSTKRLRESAPLNVHTIADAQFNANLVYSFIEVETRQGNLGKVGTITSEYKLDTDNKDYYTIDSDEYIDSAVEFPVDKSQLIIRKQISESEYTKVTVQGLTHLTEVFFDNKSKLVITQLEETEEGSNSGFFIPINTEVVGLVDYGLIDNIYYESMRLVIYAVNKQKLEWYETEEFFKFLQIVIVVASIVFMAPQLGEISGYIVAGAYSKAAAAIGMAYIKSLVIDYTVDALINEIGGEAALYLAAIIGIAALVTSSDTKSGIKGLPLADVLMQTSNSLMSGSQRYSADELKEIMKEMEKLEELNDKLQEEIEANNELLSNDTINPLSIINPRRDIVMESPDEFYFRTVHNQNPTLMIYDAIEDYAANALRLPELRKI